jgi:hypothetical protein
LKQIFDTSYRSAYCLDKLTDPQPQGKTIEFRQHRGTLNGDETVNWLLLCAGLFKLAQAMETDALEILLHAWIVIPTSSDSSVLLHVIRDVLLLPEVANFYGGKGKAATEADYEVVPIPQLS